MDWLHRVLSGGPTKRAELVGAGLFVLVWFAIDVIEFTDWAISKFSPQQTALCLPIGTPTFTSPPTTQGLFAPASK